MVFSDVRKKSSTVSLLDVTEGVTPGHGRGQGALVRARPRRSPAILEAAASRLGAAGAARARFLRAPAGVTAAPPGTAAPPEPRTPGGALGGWEMLGGKLGIAAQPLSTSRQRKV